MKTKDLSPEEAKEWMLNILKDTHPQKIKKYFDGLNWAIDGLIELTVLKFSPFTSPNLMWKILNDLFQTLAEWEEIEYLDMKAIMYSKKTRNKLKCLLSRINWNDNLQNLRIFHTTHEEVSPNINIRNIFKVSRQNRIRRAFDLLFISKLPTYLSLHLK